MDWWESRIVGFWGSGKLECRDSGAWSRGGVQDIGLSRC